MGNIGSLKTGSGLLDEATFEVTDSAFAYDPTYQSGKIPILRLKGLANGKEHTESYPVGNGWKIEGDRIAHESGQDVQIQGGTKYGMFIEAFAAIPNAVETFADIPDGDTAWGPTWIGFTFQMERKRGEYARLIDEKTGKPVEWNVLVPTEIVKYQLGLMPVGPAAVVPDIPEDVVTELTKLAASSPDFDSFISGAYEAVELRDQAYEKYVGDDSEAGFYASVT
jgi:hypothetical protein